MCNIKCPNYEDCGNCNAEMLIYQHYLLKEELSRTIDMCGSLTDLRVVAASEALNQVAVQLQKMGVVINA